MLFDGSALPVDENTRQTIEVVAEARRHGAHVEGEIEGVRGVEDGIGSDEEGEVIPVDEAVAFLEATGVDCFAPAIGTAHGVYSTEPVLKPQRVSDIVARKPIPMVLHGGTGSARRLPGPDLAGVRQGQHLHGAQGHLPRLHAGVPGRRIRGSTTRRRSSVSSGPRSRTWPSGTCTLFGSAGKAW